MKGLLKNMLVRLFFILTMSVWFNVIHHHFPIHDQTLFPVIVTLQQSKGQFIVVIMLNKPRKRDPSFH